MIAYTCILAHNSNLIFGSHPDASYTNIMITMPPEAATDYKLVRSLLEAGMDMTRINCAHDTQDMWQAMLRHIHKAEKETKKRCKIYMDLAGPKVRISQVLVPGDDDRVYTNDFFFLAGGKFPIILLIIQEMSSSPAVSRCIRPSSGRRPRRHR